MFKTNYRYPLKYLTLILWMLGRGDMEVITFFFLETQKKNTKDYKNNKNYQVYVKSKEKKSQCISEKLLMVLQSDLQLYKCLFGYF